MVSVDRFLCPAVTHNRRLADVPNPMFYMPGTKMLFGDAKDTCEGMSSYRRPLPAQLMAIFSHQARSRSSRGLRMARRHPRGSKPAQGRLHGSSVAVKQNVSGDLAVPLLYHMDFISGTYLSLISCLSNYTSCCACYDIWKAGRSDEV